MVDYVEETREHFEEPDINVPVGSTGGYFQSHPSHRSLSLRQNVQDIVSRHSSLELGRMDFLPIKTDPENLSRYGSSSTSMQASGTVPSCSVSKNINEEVKMRGGQFLPDIARDFDETFENYNGLSTPMAYRNYALPLESLQGTEADYIIPDSTPWFWARGANDERGFMGSVGHNHIPGTSQINDAASLPSLQYSTSSQLIPDAFAASLSSLTDVEMESSVSHGNLMIPRPLQSSDMSASALDLSPTSPVQTSCVPETPHMQTSTMPTPPLTHHLVTSQSSLETFDVNLQQQPLTYQQTLENSLELAAGVVEDDDNPDDVAPYTLPDLKCNQCEESFTYFHELKSHLKKNVCSRVSAQEGSSSSDKMLVLAVTTGSTEQTVVEKPKRSQRVQKSQRSFACKQCDESFSRPERLKVHELNHSGERPFRCNECSASFSVKTMLARHKKTHTGEKPYACGECKTSFTESGTLKIHMRLHTGDRPYKCDWCDEAFSGAGMLISHKRKHTGEKPYKCDECGAAFRLLSTLKSHSRRHTGEKPFSCELCGSSFTQKAALRRHRRTHLNIRPYECEHCGFKFREKENLRRHCLLHKIKYPFVCDICGAGFNSSKKLENHKMLHNGGDKPYQCCKCPSSFVSLKYLSQHKKRVHDRKGSIKCEECSATFNRKESLRSHMRIHKGLGQYVCVECGATFNQRSALTRHVRIHGDKGSSNSEAAIETLQCKENLSCRICNIDFSEKVSFENHAMEHRAVEDFAYECPSCHLGFSDHLDLLKHKKMYHPVQKPSSATVCDQDDDNNESVKDKYVCYDCDQTFFRRRQLKAHKKYCPGKHLDDLEQVEEPKANLSMQKMDKEVNAIKLVSAVLAAACGNANDLDCPLTSQTEALSSSSISAAVSATSHHLQHHQTPSQPSVSHTGLYENHLEQSSPQPLCQQSQQHQCFQQNIFHHPALHGLLQSVQGALPLTSLEEQVELVRQSRLEEHTSETLPQSLQEESHHNSPFDFDIPQPEFYKDLPPQPLLSHRSHPDTNNDNMHDLLQGSVSHNIDQHLDEYGDLHESFRHNEDILFDHREHFREEFRTQREHQQHPLHHFYEERKQQEHVEFQQQQQEGSHYEHSLQDKIQSYIQYRLLKSEGKGIEESRQLGKHEKYRGELNLTQHSLLQDQSLIKTFEECPKTVDSHSDLHDKF
ncbi:hypothetical protein SK128_022639 [Halocaridina rubra]|uniref:C2H2-type domain-containing protein n=1 Tax=Halocaridina rubra TaxID=373956 RepID=A0AAN8XB76_HALRR